MFHNLLIHAGVTYNPSHVRLSLCVAFMSGKDHSSYWGVPHSVTGEVEPRRLQALGFGIG